MLSYIKCVSHFVRGQSETLPLCFCDKKKSNNKGIFATVALLYLPPDLSLPLTVYCALKKMFQYDTKLAK